MNEVKIKFDVQDQEFVDGELKTTKKQIELLLDPSLNAQTRFEINFPVISSNGEDLLAYTTRIQKILEDKKNKNEKPTLAEIGIALKITYCWFDTSLSYEDFVKVFSFGDVEQQDKNLDKLIKVMKIVLGGSAEKN